MVSEDRRRETGDRCSSRGTGGPGVLPPGERWDSRSVRSSPRASWSLGRLAHSFDAVVSSRPATYTSRSTLDADDLRYKDHLDRGAVGAGQLVGAGGLGRCAGGGRRRQWTKAASEAFEQTNAFGLGSRFAGLANSRGTLNGPSPCPTQCAVPSRAPCCNPPRRPLRPTAVVLVRGSPIRSTA